MATGTVEWFNDAKGFGFITQDGGGEDVFCHHTAIQADGFRTLAEGQKVEVEVKKGPKGLQAADARAGALRPPRGGGREAPPSPPALGGPGSAPQPPRAGGRRSGTPPGVRRNAPSSPCR